MESRDTRGRSLGGKHRTPFNKTVEGATAVERNSDRLSQRKQSIFPGRRELKIIIIIIIIIIETDKVRDRNSFLQSDI